MKEDLNSGKWLNSLDYKIWSIAYEIADPEDQIEWIKGLLIEEIKEAYEQGYYNASRRDALCSWLIEDYLKTKGL